MERDRIQELIKDFEPERQKLIAARKAETIEGSYAVLVETRKHLQEDINQLEDTSLALHKLTERLAVLEEAHRLAGKRLTEAEKQAT